MLVCAMVNMTVCDSFQAAGKKSMGVYIFKKGLFLPLSIINGSQVRLRNNARDKLPCMLFIYILPNCFLLH